MRRMPDRRSLERALLEWLADNEGEYLTDDDIRTKWEGQFSVWNQPLCDLLRGGMDAGWLERVTTARETRYQAGPQFSEFAQQLTAWRGSIYARQLKSLARYKRAPQ